MSEKNVCVKSRRQSLVEHRLSEYGQMTFSEIKENIEEQIDISDFSAMDGYIAETLAAVMAEVLRLPDSAPVRIEGINRNARDVKEVYVQIENYHIRRVIENFKKIDYPIKYTKAYFKVQIYNSFFESGI